MLSDQEIRQRLNSFLQGNESIDSLEDWLSVEAFASIKKDSDPELRSLVVSIMHSLDLYSDDLIDEVSLKNELRALSKPNEIQEREILFLFSDIPPQHSKPDIRESRNSSVQFAYG